VKSTRVFDADRYVEVMAPAVGLTLDNHERRAVASQLERIRSFAELVGELELTPEDELAPRFEP
jgi:hypothetical protein